MNLLRSLVGPPAPRIAATVVALFLSIALASRPDALAAYEARPATSSTDARDADTLKAVFVYNFAARHVKWPDAAFADKSAPLVVGVLGTDPILAALNDTCRDRKSGDHPIEVRRLDDVSGAPNCHILFVPANREADLPAVAEKCKGRPVLIVASSERSVRQGAHIGFFLEKAKVRFAADPGAARRAGLEVSSELLKLARVVEKSVGGPP